MKLWRELSGRLRQGVAAIDPVHLAVWLAMIVAVLLTIALADPENWRALR